MNMEKLGLPQQKVIVIIKSIRNKESKMVEEIIEIGQSMDNLAGHPQQANSAAGNMHQQLEEE